MADIDFDALITAYNSITNQIIAITANPKPNYNIDGQSVSWGSYLEQLTGAQASLKKQIDANVPPFEIENQVWT